MAKHITNTKSQVVHIRPPAGTRLPIVHCSNRCGTNTAAWAWTWGTNDRGAFRYVEHPCCPQCGTSSIKILKDAKPIKVKSSAKEVENAAAIVAAIHEELAN